MPLGLCGAGAGQLLVRAESREKVPALEPGERLEKQTAGDAGTVLGSPAATAPLRWDFPSQGSLVPIPRVSGPHPGAV